MKEIKVKKMTNKNLKEYFILQMNNFNDFYLKPSSSKSPKESVEFQLKSDKIRKQLNLRHNTKNLFSFITNDLDLLFYIKKEYNQLLTHEIKQRFSSQFEGLNSAGEFKIRLNSESDIRDLIQLLFINKLESN